MVYPPEVIHRLPKCRTDGAVFFAHFAALCRITICIDDIQMGAFTLEITQLWNDACDILRNEITEVSYNTFISFKSGREDQTTEGYSNHYFTRNSR